MGLRIGSRQQRARVLRIAERRIRVTFGVEHCGRRLRTIGQ